MIPFFDFRTKYIILMFLILYDIRSFFRDLESKVIYF